VRIIALVNQKGGCGKTTTAINLAAVAARHSQRTLLVDMDPQGHCAAGLGIPEERIEGGTTAVLLGERIDLESIFWPVDPRLHVLPSTVLLSSIEAGAGGPRADRRLSEFLESVGDRFDLCLIDCPPSLGLLTMAALQAAREALIPVESGYFSLKGAQRQWDTIEAVVRRLGRDLQRWVLPTIHDPESRVSCRILETLKRQFTGRVAPVVIHEHEALRESASLGLPVCELEPDGEAQADFVQLFEWLQTQAPDLQPAAPKNGSRAAEILGRLRSQSASTPSPVPDSVQVQQTGAPQPATSLESLAGTLQGSAAPRAASPSLLTHGGPPSAASRSPGAVSIATRPEHAIAESPIDAPTSDTAATTDDVTQVVSNAVSLCGVQSTSEGVFFRQPGRPSQSLAVRGDFNGWSAIATPMRWDAQSGLFQALVPLEPGTYRYQVVVDGTPGGDPFNDDAAEAVGGGGASLLRVTATTQ
jgi:chromosome partitioning protein